MVSSNDVFNHLVFIKLIPRLIDQVILETPRGFTGIKGAARGSAARGPKSEVSLHIVCSKPSNYPGTPEHL